MWSCQLNEQPKPTVEKKNPKKLGLDRESNLGLCNDNIQHPAWISFFPFLVILPLYASAFRILWSYFNVTLFLIVASFQ